MYSVEKYHFAESVEEAYALLQRDRRNVLLAGTTWLRLGRRRYNTAIDLSRLGLDQITETEDAVRIGAMTTQRTLEQTACLRALFGGALAECVHPIVGIQFRNMATVGANLYSRCGFSDIAPVLLALDAKVRLFHAGEMSVEAFLRSNVRRDILTEIVVPKNGQRAVALSHRRTATDLAQLTLCLSQTPDGACRLAVGARPNRAALCESAAALLARGQVEQAAEAVRNDLTYGRDLRCGADYRRALAGVLTVRAWDALKEVR